MLNSYLRERYFQVRFNNEIYNYILFYIIKCPSKKCPLLYLLISATIPTKNVATIATFTDDTAIIASENLQTYLNKLQVCLDKWKGTINHAKSTHNNMFYYYTEQLTITSGRSKMCMQRTYQSKERAF